MAGTHQPRPQSPRPETGRLERKPSNSGYSSHAHHRQTSIVNGIQHRSGAHSRSGSWVNSPATSPLSPPLIMHATIGPRDMVHIPQIPPSPMTPMGPPGVAGSAREQIQLPQIPSSPVTLNAPPISDGNNMTSNLAGGVGGLGSLGQQMAGDRPSMASQQTSPAVMQFQKPPRNRAHHHSHSHHHSSHSRPRDEETKTPAEYALHILFTQFVRVAERKINTCLPPNHPLETEPQIEGICGAGVDPAFDKLIGSLGLYVRWVSGLVSVDTDLRSIRLYRST